VNVDLNQAGGEGKFDLIATTEVGRQNTWH
jgi:hypothetical protein